MAADAASSANRVRTAQILLLVVVIVGALYVMDAVVGSGLVRRPYQVTVNLYASGGLYPGSVVSYRGNRIGKVTDLDVTQDGVRAEASIDKGTRIPVDSEAVVSNLSAVGEQRLDFRPRVDHGPWLKGGSVVAEKDTGLPLATSTFFLHTKTLTDQIDVNDVRTISGELGKAFGDPDLDLRRLYDQGDQTLGTLERLQPATISLIERGQVPLQTVSDNSDQLLQFSKDVEALTGLAEAGQPRPRLAGPQRQGPAARAARRARRQPDDPRRPARQRPGGQRDRCRPPAGPDDLARLRAAPGEGDDRRHPRRLRVASYSCPTRPSCASTTPSSASPATKPSCPPTGAATAPRSTR